MEKQNKLDAWPLEIDGHTVYITDIDFDEDQLFVKMLPDPNLPPHFEDDLIISKAIRDILMEMYANEEKR